MISDGLATVERQVQRVHRITYAQEVGPIPDGKDLHHRVTCTKACCNPDHLTPVTPLEHGALDKSIGSINRDKTHCPKGHAYDGGNLLIRITARGYNNRFCRQCHADVCHRYSVSDEGRKRGLGAVRRWRVRQKENARGT
jgi:hypothetical protein